MENKDTKPPQHGYGRRILATVAGALLIVFAGSAGISVAEESEDVKSLMVLAGDGDKDASLQLAKHFATGAEPDHETAAKYAMIALADGGQKYAAPLVSNTRAWPREFWRMLQLELLTNGDYTSTIDGLPGPGTKKAVLAFAGAKAPVATQRVKKRYRKKKVPRGSYSN